MQAMRTSPRTRLHSTSGNVSVNYPGGEYGSKELFRDLFPATHDTLKSSGHGSKTTILNPKQQSETTVQNKAETKQHKTKEAECEKPTRKTKVKTKTLKTKQNETKPGSPEEMPTINGAETPTCLPDGSSREGRPS